MIRPVCQKHFDPHFKQRPSPQRSSPRPANLKWEEPRNPKELHSDFKASGQSMGTIHPRLFETTTWEPMLTYDVGRRQYGKFVAAMLERIRAGESPTDEVRKFTELMTTNHNWQFLSVAEPHIPELKDNYPHDPKHFELTLLYHNLNTALRERKNYPRPEPSAPRGVNLTYGDGLNRDEKALIWYNMFGPDTGAEPSESMKRLFQSTLEFWPQAALDGLVKEACDRGTDITRDHQGLPTKLRLPPSPPKPTPSSQPSPEQAYISPLDGTAETTPESSRERPPIVEKDLPSIDSPPRDLLTEVEVEGIDQPVSVTPIKKKTPPSHDSLPAIRSVEEAIAFTARREESPKRYQVPLDFPPPEPKTRAERLFFRDIKHCRKQVLNYFHVMNAARPVDLPPERPLGWPNTYTPDLPDTHSYAIPYVTSHPPGLNNTAAPGFVPPPGLAPLVPSPAIAPPPGLPAQPKYQNLQYSLDAPSTSPVPRTCPITTPNTPVPQLNQFDKYRATVEEKDGVLDGWTDCDEDDG